MGSLPLALPLSRVVNGIIRFNDAVAGPWRNDESSYFTSRETVPSALRYSYLARLRVRSGLAVEDPLPDVTLSHIFDAVTNAFLEAL